MFDAVTLAAVAEELNAHVLHGRVQEIVQLDALTFGFEIYAQHARRYLYVSLHADEARIHLVAGRCRGSGETPPPLLMLLRKYVQGALVDEIVQLPHERVLQIRFDHATEGIAKLIIETIGRYSNLVLTDVDGTVIDALKRVSADINRTRTVLPKQTYAPPPPQSKLDPASVSSAELARELEKNRGARLWQALVKSIAGVSPLLAREIAFRLQGDTEVPVEPTRAFAVLNILRELSQPPWQPTVAWEGDEPVEYAPYVLTQYADSRRLDSISAAIEAFYGTPGSYAAVKEPLRAQIAEARDRLARKRDSLAQSLPTAEQVERLRESGELILAYASQMRPAQKTYAAETETGVVEIPLDPKLTPIENAQAYFKDYHRAKDALERIPPLLQAAQVDVDYADQMLNDLELADGRAEIDAVIQAAREAGLLSAARSKARAAEATPRAFTSRDGLQILVGKNARQNEEITFRRARPDDLWLHARNVSGAHVVIVRGGRDIPESTVEQAAELAAFYSQARGEANVDVIVAPRRNVHRLRGGKAGMVTVREERTVRASGKQLDR